MNRMILGAFSVMLALSSCRALVAQSPGEWPSYRHDAQLTGRSAGKGNLSDAPVEIWTYYLGGYDGLLEVNASKGSQSAGTRPPGEFGQSYFAENAGKWRPQPLVDMAGDGRLAPPPAGRIARLLPAVAGLQQVVWEADPEIPNSGRGKCFAFDQGADRPRLVWQTETEREVYEMLWTIGDVDADGALDVVFMTHYRVVVYDGQTGKKKSTIAWDVGRNYGQMSLANVDGEPGDEIVVVVDSPPHVDLLKYAPEKGKLVWQTRYVTDAQVLLPIDVRLYIIPNGVVDVDGDGRVEIVYNLYNHGGDRRWHVVIRDALTGDIRWDLPETYAVGIADFGQPKKSLCCLEASGIGVPEVAEGLLLMLQGGDWKTLWRGARARWQVEPYQWPASQHSIASLGPTTNETLRRCDVDADGLPELFAALDNRRLVALGLNESSEIAVKWSLESPAESQIAVEASRHDNGAVLVNIDSPRLSWVARDCTVVERAWHVRNSFAPLPARPLAMVANIDGEGANEVLVQDTHWRSRVLRIEKDKGQPTAIAEALRLEGGGLWLGRRWPGFPYSKFPIYTADLDQDGRREFLLTDVADEQVATVTCRESNGAVRWTALLPQTPARGIVWIVAGRFRDARNIDLFVVVQNGGLGEGLVLDGASGDIVWRRAELRLADGTPFWLGSQHPALAAADADGDGLDDILGNTDPYLLAVRGRDGEPLAPPRSMIADLFPNFVVYGESIVGDWDASGRPSIFTNTPIGGFGLVSPEMKAKWFVNREKAPRNCSGAVGRLSSDSPWLYGTMVGTKFSAFDLRSGALAGEAEVGVDPGAYASMYAADINGDGDDEFLAVAGVTLFCVGHDKERGWQMEWRATLAGDTGPLTIADVDGDGFLDILYTTGDGYVRCLGKQAVRAN
jgi:hypothetical protein